MNHLALGPRLLLGCALLTACASAPLEPERAFVDLPRETHPFSVVWECWAEAAEHEGFALVTSQREGQAGGRLLTEMKPSRARPLDGPQRAQRVLVLLERGAEGGYQVRLAASSLRAAQPT